MTYHKLLPESAQTILRQATRVKPTESDPLARVKAIDAAVARVKVLFPECFQEDDDAARQVDR